MTLFGLPPMRRFEPLPEDAEVVFILRGVQEFRVLVRGNFLWVLGTTNMLE